MLTMCMMMCLMGPMNVYADNSDFWVIDFGEGYKVNVLEIATENGVDPYELKEAILEDMKSDRFSPFSKVDSTKIVAEPLETVEYVYDSKTRAVRATARKNNQTATAYTGASGSLTASGKTPAVGMCAMDIDVTTKTGNTTNEIVRLGTKLYLDEFINVNGSQISSLVVEDRGTGSATHTTYWIDVCFGITTSATNAAAINFGKQTLSYTYLY